MSIEMRLKELGLTIPEPAQSLGHFLPAIQVGNLIFVSGQIPAFSGHVAMQGKVGRDLSIEQGQEAARLALLNVLAAIQGVTGNLNAVKRIVKLNGWVASAEGFHSQPKVIDGASQVLEEIFGEAGRHARAAIGVAELPLGVPVELELIVEV